MNAFQEAWAEVRARMQNADFAADEEIDQLRSLTNSPFHSALVAQIEIVTGVQRGRDDLYGRGITNLHASSPKERADAIKALPDLTILGSPSIRKTILLPVFEMMLPEDDAALNFVLDPGIADARAILNGDWKSEGLPSNLNQELRLWLAWTALEAWLSYRSLEYMKLIQHDAVRLQAPELSAWEFGLVDALSTLSKGSVERSLDSIRILLAPGELSRASWKTRRISSEMLRFAPLAGQEVDSWLETAPSLTTSYETATDAEERMGATFQALISGANRSSRNLERVWDELLTRPWALFCFFLSVPQDQLRERLAKELLASIRSDGDIRRWPWSGRVTLFCTACEKLEDGALALKLLDLVAHAQGDKEVRLACARVIESLPSHELRHVMSGSLAETLAEYADLLSSERAQIVSRGGVMRAVVDGLNVCFGGKSKEAGAKPDFSYLDQALKSLKSAGFTDIHVFFDASARYRMGEAWSQVSRLQVRDAAVVVPGVADTKIIEKFLEAPDISWIITCDMYRDHLANFENFHTWWPQNQLRFFIDEGTLKWERPLDRPKKTGESR